MPNPTQHSLPEVPDAVQGLIREKAREGRVQFHPTLEALKELWPSLHAAWEKERETEGEFTIRVCECGCVHDLPDAGCPQCESKINTPIEVLRADSPGVLSKEEARLLRRFDLNAAELEDAEDYDPALRTLLSRLSDWAEERTGDGD